MGEQGLELWKENLPAWQYAGSIPELCVGLCPAFSSAIVKQDSDTLPSFPT